MGNALEKELERRRAEDLRRDKPSRQPSDFERGVLHAANFLRTKGSLGYALARELLTTTPKDVEGTESRVVKQIADWLADGSLGLEVFNLSLLAQDIRSGAWKLP
jgi:hypothetical protein